MKNRRFGVLFAVVLIVASMGYIILSGFSENKVYYTTIKEWRNNPVRYKGLRLKIGGVVAQNSIKRNDNEMTLEFLIKQDQDTLPVKYKGIVPDTFQDNTEVIIEGRFGNGMFIADNILTKCASRYEGEVLPESGTDEDFEK